MAVTSGPWQADREWDLLQLAHPNVLVVGSHAAVAEALHILAGICGDPVATCRAASPLALPPTAGTGALILRDVDCLTPAGQRRLMRWLENVSGRIQVIATSTKPLWSQVQGGFFLEALYYRLNVIYIDVTDTTPGGA
jgi:transcriptional regulator of acetoin/glycerol metabolism